MSNLLDSLTEGKKKYVYLVMAFVLSMASSIYWDISSLDETISYIDNAPALVIMCILLLALWPTLKGRPMLVASTLILLGGISNIVVGIANHGQFPVSGYTMEEFTQLVVTNQTNGSYYTLGGKLTLLGDHAALAGMSIGDIFAGLGGLLLIGIALFYYWKSRKARNPHDVNKESQ